MTSIKHKPTIHFKWSLDSLQFVSFCVRDDRVAHVFTFLHVLKHLEHFSDSCRVTGQLRDLKERDQCVNECFTRTTDGPRVYIGSRLQCILVTTNTQLWRVHFFLRKEHFWLTSMFKKFGYNEYRLKSIFLCIKLLIVSETQSTKVLALK